MVRIGITGANGRIGTVLRKSFEKIPEFKLKLFTYDPPEGAVFQSEPIPDHFDTVLVDFGDKNQVAGAFEGLDVVIHLAALVDVTPYGENWEAMWKSNFEATYLVFKECERANVKRIVFASSNHVQNGYTMNDPKVTESLDLNKLAGKPMTLNDPPYPDSMYAVAKLFGEDIGKLFALHSRIEVVSLRIGWVYSGLIGNQYVTVVNDPKMILRLSKVTDNISQSTSDRDCVEIFKKAVTVSVKSETGIPYMAAYACSNNKIKVWDLQESIRNLEYTPQDSAEKFFE